MKKTKTDRFFELFAGEFIQIILDKDLESTEQSEDTVSIQKTPLSVVGFLIEEDDDYVFLGQDPLASVISSAVRKDFIVHIQVAELEDEIETNDIGAPAKGKWN